MLNRRRLAEMGLGLGALGAGFTAGLVGLGGTPRAGRANRGWGFLGRESERPALWAADRAGHALYALAADGAVLRRIEVDAPLEVRTSRGGGCLVLSALDRCCAGPARWLEWTGSGLREVPEGLRLPGVEASAPFRREPDETLTIRRSAGGDEAWVLRGGSAPIAIERWERVTLPDRVTLPERVTLPDRLTLPGRVALPDREDLPEPREGRSRGIGKGQQGRSRGDWVLRMSSPLPFTARALAPVEGAVWIAGDRVAQARLVARSGAVLRDVTLEGADGVEDALAIPKTMGGGVWLAACGALVRLDVRGHRQPGQGGFAHLVSLAAGPQSFGS